MKNQHICRPAAIHQEVCRARTPGDRTPRQSQEWDRKKSSDTATSNFKNLQATPQATSKVASNQHGENPMTQLYNANLQKGQRIWLKSTEGAFMGFWLSSGLQVAKHLTETRKFLANKFFLLAISDPIVVAAQMAADWTRMISRFCARPAKSEPARPVR